MFIEICPVPGTTLYPPPGPSAKETFSNADDTASLFKSPFVVITACSYNLMARYIPVAALPAVN